jgi:transcriptional regulator with XRE-family HTH domain
MRLDAGLSARALASLAGWHFTKVSRLENGKRPPSTDDIRTWCRCTGAEDQLVDLIATARSIDAMYSEWRRHARAGLKHFQESYVPLYEQTGLFRVYENSVIPGLLNTAGYAAATLRFWAGLLDLPADTDTAVAARMERQNILYSRTRSFQFVIEEQSLRTRIGGAEIMAEQLDRLLALMSLPAVRLGIIPAAGERQGRANCNFWMYDDALVQVETVSARLDIAQPAEITLYARVFELLQRSAVYGPDARALIGRALAEVTAAG